MISPDEFHGHAWVLSWSRYLNRSTHVDVFETFTLSWDHRVARGLVPWTNVKSIFILSSQLSVISAWPRIELSRIVKHWCVRCAWTERIFRRWSLNGFRLWLVGSWPWYALLSRWIFFKIHLYSNMNKKRMCCFYPFKFISRDTEWEGLHHLAWGDVILLRTRPTCIIYHVSETPTIPNARWSFALLRRGCVDLITTKVIHVSLNLRAY